MHCSRIESLAGIALHCRERNLDFSAHWIPGMGLGFTLLSPCCGAEVSSLKSEYFCSQCHRGLIPRSYSVWGGTGAIMELTMEFLQRCADLVFSTSEGILERLVIQQKVQLWVTESTIAVLSELGEQFFRDREKCRELHK